MALGYRGQVGDCDYVEVETVSKIMKRRIFAGGICEQLVYPVGSGVKDPGAFTPEKQPRKRFKTEEEYERFKLEIARRKHNRNFHANFAPGDIYSTLTFDDEWEVHTFQEAKRIRSNFVRTLLRKFPDAVIFLYMGRGKGTQRIHFHMVSHGIPKEFIDEKWKYGSVKRFAELRAHNWYEGVDHGADFTGLANYLFNHWTPEIGGHRWFQSKNARKAEMEEPTEVRVTGGYSEKRPPVPPKGYKLVDCKRSQFGYWYFKYVAEPQKIKRRTGSMCRLD